jgi:hypothetical protein
MTIHPIADIIGAGNTVALSASQGQRARRIWLTAHGSSNARFGNASTAAAVGVELPADQLCVFSASDADMTDGIDMTVASVFVPNGTTVTGAYGI